MRIDNLSHYEWIEISDILSKNCIDEPVIRKLLGTIKSRTDIFNMTHDFLKKNKFNPIFFPDRPSVETCKDGYGFMKRLSRYKTPKGKGLVQFRKDYQEYILKKYKIQEKKQQVNQ